MQLPPRFLFLIMRFSAFALAGAVSCVVLALPASVPHVVHERRSPSSSWTPLTGVKPNKTIKLPVRIGLTQSNLDRGHDVLMDVSDPFSENYGKHWTAKQVSSHYLNVRAVWKLMPCSRLPIFSRRPKRPLTLWAAGLKRPASKHPAFLCPLAETG